MGADSSKWEVAQSLLGIGLIAVVNFVSSKLKYWYHGEGNVHFSQELTTAKAMYILARSLFDIFVIIRVFLFHSRSYDVYLIQ